MRNALVSIAGLFVVCSETAFILGTAVPNPAWGFAPNPTRDIVPGPFFASRGLKPLFSRKAYSPHSAIRPSMVPSASQPVTSSSIFAESSEPFFVATP